jgi:acetyltransferase-like isoleucine patch superfamily enzyme
MYPPDRMNFSYWIKRLSFRATCILGEKSKFASSARVHNMQGESDSITIGSNSVIAGELLIFRHGGRITIGDWCYIGEGTRVWSSCSIKIGDRVLIAHNVNIFDSRTHPINPRERHAHFREIKDHGHPLKINLGEKPVTIADDAWIGANATILRGVTIGTGAIVGAGSVVTGDVAPFMIVSGNPAHVVRKLGEDER